MGHGTPPGVGLGPWGPPLDLETAPGGPPMAPKTRPGHNDVPAQHPQDFVVLSVQIFSHPFPTIFREFTSFVPNFSDFFPIFGNFFIFRL